MKVLFYVLILLLLLLVIFYNIIGINNNNNNNNNNKNKNKNNKEKFLTENIDPEKDGKMTFTYLTNPTYANSILSRYYINDDKKILGYRVVQHPLQIPRTVNGRDMYYGTLFYNKQNSDNIYKGTGIRM